MSGHIYAFLTATKATWADDESDDYTEEHGWVDVPWSKTVLHESRNDVRPVADWPEDDPTDGGRYEDLTDAVREAFRNFEGWAEDNGDGTFRDSGEYDSGEYSPYDEPASYTYALHFSRKFQRPNGEWTEEPWHPVTDGGVDLAEAGAIRKPRTED